MRKKYPCHPLTPVKDESIPSRLLFFDTESHIVHDDNGFTLPFKMAWTCFINRAKLKSGYVENWQFHKTAFSVCKHIVSKSYDKTCLYVFAHNVYHDLKTIDWFTFAQNDGWVIDLLIDSGKTSCLKVKKDKRSIIFLSTTNFFSFSLGVLGEKIGLSKGKVDFESDNFDTIKKYCRQDTVIIKEVVLKIFDYIHNNSLGRFCITSPSQAMFAYRFRFMPCMIFPPDDEMIVEHERLSYHGGRTECFHIGNLTKKRLKVYDINSMYPFVMRNNDFPTYAKYVYEHMSIDKLKKALKYYLVIATVKIRTNEPVYCHTMNKRVVFPIGTFITTLTTPEIEYALKHNHIKKVMRTVVYSKRNIFKNYVDFFYKQKQAYKKDGNKPYENITKLFLNSLYGKFGQRGYSQDVDVDHFGEVPCRELIINIETNRVYWKTVLINTQITDKDGEKPRHTFTAISSHITAYARIYLWKLIKKAGIKHVYYCDTDSLFVDKTGERRLKKYIHNTVLGKLKLEKTPNTLIIRGLKDYIIDGNLKVKGIRKNAENLFNFFFIQDQFESLKTGIKKGHLDKPYVKKIIKVLTHEYKKGIVKPSGRVYPFRIRYRSLLVDQ